MEAKDLPDSCERCGRENKRSLNVPNGHRLGGSCLAVLEERSQLRRSGEGPVAVHICTDTGRQYWQDVQFDNVCPNGVSCWACDYMLRDTCKAEEKVGIRRHGNKRLEDAKIPLSGHAVVKSEGPKVEGRTVLSWKDW